MKMISKIVLGFSLMLSGMFVSLQAQEAKTVFKNMPDSLSPLLTSVNRADFVDFKESNMKAQVENRLGGKSEMTDLGKDYLRIQLTSQTSWQMKLLALNDTAKIICTVYTACAPACDSRIRLYTTDWKELPTEGVIGLPAMTDYIMAPDSADIYEFDSSYREADLLLQKADFTKENDELTFTLTTPGYMEKEMAEKLKPFIRHSIVYHWKEGKFVR